jgi:hypothetical protein
MLYFTSMMMKIRGAILLLCCLACFLSCRSKIVPQRQYIHQRLGHDTVRISIDQYGSSNGLVFINLHANENTSVAAAKKLLERKGGLLVKIENGNKRNISFRLNDSSYTFDPNRIFSRNGIRRTLAHFKTTSEEAVNSIDSFAARILSLFPPGPACIIALHNNTEGGLAIHSYAKGNVYQKDAKVISVNEKEDPDDFYLTTDSLLFSALSKTGYNSVWQDNAGADDDGSLSVYCGKKNIPYLNCETQHGRMKQHLRMLKKALTIIEGR